MPRKQYRRKRKFNQYGGKKKRSSNPFDRLLQSQRQSGGKKQKGGKRSQKGGLPFLAALIPAAIAAAKAAAGGAVAAGAGFGVERGLKALSK